MPASRYHLENLKFLLQYLYSLNLLTYWLPPKHPPKVGCPVREQRCKNMIAEFHASWHSRVWNTITGVTRGHCKGVLWWWGGERRVEPEWEGNWVSVVHHFSLISRNTGFGRNNAIGCGWEGSWMSHTRWAAIWTFHLKCYMVCLSVILLCYRITCL